MTVGLPGRVRGPGKQYHSPRAGTSAMKVNRVCDLPRQALHFTMYCAG